MPDRHRPACCWATRRDTFTGSRGADDLNGGRGADRFVFARGDGADRIMDFRPGQDRLYLVAGTVPTRWDAADHVHETADGVLLRLGQGDRILFAGLTDVDALAGAVGLLQVALDVTVRLRQKAGKPRGGPMGIGRTIKRIFTWWDGQTLNTALFTARKGLRVGADGAGNVYYRTRDDARRWVIYNGEIEGSRVSPDWHGWLHRTWDSPPSESPLVHKPWEQPHLPNLSGTAAAHVPAGSIRRADPAQRRDYDAWSPE